MLGAVLGYLLVRRLAQGAGIDPEQITDLTLWLMLFGFLGARLYHVLNEPAYYAANPLEIFAIWNGGLAIHGGIAAGVIVIWFWAKRNGPARHPIQSPPEGTSSGLPFLTVLDTVAPGLLLGQAIGRWGNYFNQELFGSPTDLPWKLFIAPEHRPEGFAGEAFFHPTFLYESLGSLLILVFVLVLLRRMRRAGSGFSGLVAFLSLGLWQLLRFGTELLRIDRVPEVLGVRLPLLVSSALAVAAFLLLFFLWYRNHAQPQHN